MTKEFKSFVKYTLFIRFERKISKTNQKINQFKESQKNSNHSLKYTLFVPLERKISKTIQRYFLSFICNNALFNALLTFKSYKVLSKEWSKLFFKDEFKDEFKESLNNSIYSFIHSFIHSLFVILWRENIVIASHHIKNEIMK
jgi:hypothetical protein